MAGIASHQQPTPERFFNAINAYEQTGAMKTAVELEIFYRHRRRQYYGRNWNNQKQHWTHFE